MKMDKNTSQKGGNKSGNTLLITMVQICFFIYYSILMYNIIIIDKTVEYSGKRNMLVNNSIIVIIVIIGLVLLSFLLAKYRKEIAIFLEKYYKHILICSGIIVFALQQVFINKSYYLQGWDAGTLVNAARSIAYSNSIEGDWYIMYYSVYPNNFTLAYIFSVLIKIGNKLQLSDNTVLLYYISGWCTMYSGILAVMSIKKWTKSSCASILAWILLIPMVVLSPWVLVPYSDTYVMPFIITCFFSFIKLKEKKISYLWWIIMIGSAMFGYLIKPTAIIVLIAITIVLIWNFICNKKKQWKHCIIKGVIVCIIAGIMLQVPNFISDSINFTPIEGKEFTMTHFAMMGLAESTGGGYNLDDVNYSKSFDTKKERQEGNIEVIKQRLKDYGIKGYTQFLLKKQLKIFNDGTFAWGGEGGFFSNVPKEGEERYSEITHNTFFDLSKESSLLWQTSCQCLWISILIFMSGIFLFRKKFDDVGAVALLAILGISVFLLLFEARARYLFCYIPIFIIVGAVGLRNIINTMLSFLYKNN